MLTEARTDGRKQMDDGQKVITITHPEHSSGELKISGFLPENFQFLEVKLSIYLNRPVFIITSQSTLLTFTILWANSADDKLMIFFLFFPNGNNLHAMSNPIF